ncbi:PPOX class F420-dependent oxidoreductase [Blastococcus sp. Marseille-P5729]|uniref:PPOX class F420-dependent oxidoreductase n=1 Tax=Blastococcus sp. Marseille-P5729 TaxID=2086582 RepID=UPI000D0F6293|nr:PPOX class F420-dependent oxidoreductase [Blastococcus sp. Marseille-P5729]
MSDAWEGCKKARYVSLETYRKDGSAVRTPVWIAPDKEAPGDRLVVWTVSDSWKVKRIRRTPAVRIAPCTVRGQITGDWVAAHAELLTASQSAIAARWLHAKYGIQSRVAVALSRLRRGSDGTVCIAVTQAAPQNRRP